MPNLTDFPVELLHLTLTQLRAFEVELVARTFNKRLYDICLPFLTRRLVYHRNNQLMRRRFTFDKLPNLDFMDLKGDLRWLSPIDMGPRRTDLQHNPWARSESEEQDEVEKLVRTAQRLGLALPEEFLLFMRSQALRTRIPGDEYTLSLGGLRKCPGAVDKWAGGFIICFLRDDDWDREYYSLYLNSNGHCVLRSKHDLDHQSHEYYCMLADDYIIRRDIDASMEVGVKLAMLYPYDMVLVATDFESFLVQRYYSVLYWEVTPPISPYTRQIFAKIGDPYPSDEEDYDEEEEEDEEEESDENEEEDGAHNEPSPDDKVP